MVCMMIQWMFSGIGSALLSSLLSGGIDNAPASAPPSVSEQPAWTRTASITLTAPQRKTGNKCWDLLRCLGGTKTRPDLVLCIETPEGVPLCPSREDLWVRKCADTFQCTVRATVPDTQSFRVWLLDLDQTDKHVDIIGEGECHVGIRCDLPPAKMGWNSGSVFVKLD
jgi:hypothetical protein